MTGYLPYYSVTCPTTYLTATTTGSTTLSGISMVINWDSAVTGGYWQALTTTGTVTGPTCIACDDGWKSVTRQKFSFTLTKDSSAGYTNYTGDWIYPITDTLAQLTQYNGNFFAEGMPVIAWRSSYVFPTPAAQLKEILKSRRFPGIITQTKPMGHTLDAREVRARETLRRVIGDDKYKNFLKQGWVSVKAKSGLTYQIFPGHGITSVYKQGKMIERLCVVLSGNFPPTDSVIIRYLLILNNETMFRNKAVKHGVHPRVKHPIAVADRPIIEIAREVGLFKKVG
jgi:hypothetical protein